MRTIAVLSCYLLLSANCHSTTIRRVLFLGNSYTYTNNLPQLIANMARATGDSLVFDSYTPGGYTLDQHALDPVSRGKVMTGNWDYLVLQEQSQLPAIPGYYSNELSGLCDLFRTHNPCGRLLFYMTWGRKNGDAVNCASFPTMCTYIGMDTMLRANYLSMARAQLGDLSPVGAVWRYVRQQAPAIDLYQPDESHPSEAGSYLAACSFYAAIFQKNPTPAGYNFVLNPADAATIRQAAKRVTFDSLSYWCASPRTLTADFSYAIAAGTNTVQFLDETTAINNIPLADAYHWDFGDGATSTLRHPMHSYSSNGTYIVTLTSTNCDIDTTYQSVYRDTLSFCAYTPTIYPASLMLCPGTTDTLWTQPADTYQWYDEWGHLIPNATNRYYVCTGGSRYSVKVSRNGCAEMSVPVDVGAHTGIASQFSIVESGNLVGEDTACAGSSLIVSLTFSKPPFPDDSLIDWAYNGLPVANHHNDTLIVAASGTYSVTVRHRFCPGLDRTMTRTYIFVHCPLGIGAPVNEPAVVVYPNAGTGLYNLVCRQAGRITLYDMYGRSITGRYVGAGKHQIDLRNEVPGLYMICFSGDHVRECIRLVKE